MSDPCILCIETATEVCSVAISKGDQVIYETHLSEGQQHSSQLTILIDRCLETSGYERMHLNAVAISDGPGSYTGLRVGASVAKGIAYALDIPLLTISTLQALADGFRNTEGIVVPSIDARRMEAYIGIYQEGEEVAPVTNIIWSERIFDKWCEAYDQLLICGNGIAKARDVMTIPDKIKVVPSACNASYLTRIALYKYRNQEFADLAYHTPFYFKAPNITVPKAKLTQ